MKKPVSQDYSAYLTYIGGGHYQIFIKNNSSSADFVRIIMGHTSMQNGERIGRVVRDWIISPLKANSAAVFIGDVNKNELRGVRFWVAFQGMKRNKPKNILIGVFVALSPMPSKWFRTIGSTTPFEIKSFSPGKALDSIKQLPLVPELISDPHNR